MNDISKTNISIIVGILICLVGAWYVYITMASFKYDIAQSIKIHQKLERYYLYKNSKSRGRTYLSTIMVLNDGSKYWTDVVSDESAEAMFKNENTDIITYANLESAISHKDGAIRCYGLWVNGNQISTPAYDLEEINRGLWVLLGFTSCTGFVLIFGGLKRKFKIGVAGGTVGTALESSKKFSWKRPVRVETKRR